MKKSTTSSIVTIIKFVDRLHIILYYNYYHNVDVIVLAPTLSRNAVKLSVDHKLSKGVHTFKVDRSISK